MKWWWSKGQFRSKSESTMWKTSKFRKSVQIIVILLSRVFGRKDGSTFLDKWIPIIYQIITSGSTLNWGELFSSNIDVQLRKVQKDHQFYMSSYLMNVMCASLEFSSLGWKWESSLPLIHVGCLGQTQDSLILHSNKGPSITDPFGSRSRSVLPSHLKWLMGGVEDFGVSTWCSSRFPTS